MDFVHNSNLYQLVTEPTRFRINNLPSTLDLIFTNDTHVLTDHKVGKPIGISDHSQFNLERSSFGDNISSYEVINYDIINRLLTNTNWDEDLGDSEDPEEV
ncbi:hypothetical protein HHI36_010663 [Cryptolaemus montrouzieri]|uniref:Uncharacterized protein n=1 Tax=Cryptolaemus montrouzieri TaxID=559131 RepID=A0ABD2MJG6_9CUCU